MEILGFSNPRRIVTGVGEDGLSRFARVEEVEIDFREGTGLARDVYVHRIWASDKLPMVLPFAGTTALLDSAPNAEETPEALRRSSPQPGGPHGWRLSMVKFAPNHASALHWHPTVDVQWLMAGQLTIGLDDGTEVDVWPGDAIVQHGTNHSWRAGPEGAVVALFMLGAYQEGTTPPIADRRFWTPQALAEGRGGAKGPDGKPEP